MSAQTADSPQTSTRDDLDIESELHDVQLLLATTIERLPEPSRSACARIVGGGGKRLRPELIIRAAHSGKFELLDQVQHGPAVSNNPGAVVRAAAAIELMHSATLIHDDFLDDSHTRRGVPTINMAEGAGAAILAGDALIAQSFRLMAAAGVEAVEDLADSLADMCAGQGLEDQLRFYAAAEPAEVLMVSRLKTGSLLRAACRIGARLGGLSPGEIDSLGDFGSDFGVALQLIDDTLDLISDKATLGKPCGADFALGLMTMPTFFALKSGSPDRSHLTNSQGSHPGNLSAFLHPDLAPEDCETARDLLVCSDGPVRTIVLARAFADRAAAAVPTMTESYRYLAELPTQYVENQLRTKVSPRHQRILNKLPDSPGIGDGQNFLEMLDPTG